jgi:hypothetical protein
MLGWSSGWSTPILRNLGVWNANKLGKVVEQISLACRTGEGKICLLEILRKGLDSGHSTLVDHFIERMDGKLCLRWMLEAVNRRRQGSRFLAEGHNCDAIAARVLDRCDIEAEFAASLNRTRNVEMVIAVAHKARDRGPHRLLADLAIRSFALSQRQWHTLGGFQALCIAEFDLRSKQRAGHVDPVIVGSPFKCFARELWSALVLLLLAVLLSKLRCQFPLNSLLLLLMVILLLVWNSRWLDQLALCNMDRA